LSFGTVLSWGLLSIRVPFARFFLYLGLNFQFRLVLQLKTLAEAAVLTVNCDSGVF
jgi:hypothetical protein